MVGAATFGELLRHLRKRAGLTQGALATAAGCSVSYISALETGQRRPDAGMVRAQVAPALAAAGDARLVDRLLELAAGADGISPAESVSSPLLRPNDDVGMIPAESDGLFGREADIDALSQRLMNHPGRLITLTGPPGVGKTRLAQSVVGILAPFHADGAHIFRLGEVIGGESAATAMSTALHLPEDKRSPEVGLVTHLRSREVLLLLDNFDRFARDPSAAALVAGLLTACPRVRILATSCMRLKVRAEQSFRIQPLDRRNAASLFVARVRHHQPSYMPTLVQRQAIDEICRLLDDLPLAIEWIAAHASEMTVPDLLVHIRTDRLALLGRRTPKISSEQRTLTAALQHSYALLAPAEQRALRMLSVFEGGTRLDGVAALAIDLPVVLSLADKSLVQLESVGGDRRVRLLETVREYAAMQLTAAGESEDAHQQLTFPASPAPLRP